jgi:hypothetical protein
MRSGNNEGCPGLSQSANPKLNWRYGRVVYDAEELPVVFVLYNTTYRLLGTEAPG